MAKNTHLTHAEDKILTEGISGAKDAIEMLKVMGGFLSGKQVPGKKPLVTEKWDGAPAVVCGTDPSDGQFFVGTKSVFAKTNPKMCKSDSDIERNYSGALASKLKACLKFLPGHVNGILQGDLMFTNDKKHERIDGGQYITFRPNTLTYAAPDNSPLGHQIERAKLGVVWHTKYTGGPTVQDMSASFNVNKNDFRTGGSVWAQAAEYQDVSGAANMSSQERQKYDAAIRRAEGSLKQARPILNKIQSGKKTLAPDTELLKFFNNYVKVGREIPSVQRAYDDFMFHMGREVDKQVQGKKTMLAQEKTSMKFLTVIDMMEQNETSFKALIALYMNIQYCKNILVRQLQKVQSVRVFADMGNMYKAATPEGYVAVQGSKAIKLVDRLDFSRLNFTIPKKW